MSVESTHYAYLQEAEAEAMELFNIYQELPVGTREEAEALRKLSANTNEASAVFRERHGLVQLPNSSYIDCAEGIFKPALWYPSSYNVMQTTCDMFTYNRHGEDVLEIEGEYNFPFLCLGLYYTRIIYFASESDDIEDADVINGYFAYGYRKSETYPYQPLRLSIPLEDSTHFGPSVINN